MIEFISSSFVLKSNTWFCDCFFSSRLTSVDKVCTHWSCGNTNCAEWARRHVWNEPSLILFSVVRYLRRRMWSTRFIEMVAYMLLTVTRECMHALYCFQSCCDLASRGQFAFNFVLLMSSSWHCPNPYIMLCYLWFVLKITKCQVDGDYMAPARMSKTVCRAWDERSLCICLPVREMFWTAAWILLVCVSTATRH